MRTTSERRGFTLIELLVVIAIIGTLSSIIISSLSVARKKGADATAKSDLVNMHTQAELFYDSHGNTYISGSNNVCLPAIFSYHKPWIPAGAQNLLAAAGVPATPNSFLQGAGQAEGISSVTIGGAGGAGVTVCNVNATAWVAEVPLTAQAGFFCVDSTGVATTSANSQVTSSSDYSC